MGNKGDIPGKGRARSDLPALDQVAALLTSRPRQKKAGPGNPGKRATVAEVEERIIVVARMLTARLHKHQIKQYLANKFDLGARSAEAYIARARVWLLKQTRRPRDDFVAEAVGFYHEIIRSPELSTREKMDAQAALREMLGLDQPFKIAPTTPDGQAAYIPDEIVHTMTIEELAVLRALHLRLQQDDAGLRMDRNTASNATNRIVTLNLGNVKIGAVTRPLIRD